MADNGLLHNGEHIEVLGTEKTAVAEKDKDEDNICRCHPRWPYAIACLLPCITFMIGMNVRKLPKEPFQWGNLLPITMPSDWPDGVSMLMLMWTFHFVRRFAEVLLIHIYTKRISILFTFGAPIYYSFFGLWIGWSMNYYFGYDAPPLYILVPGTVLFVIGQVGNCASHIMLRRLRTAPEPKKKKPDGPAFPEGILFKLVVCPHYTFEVITWMGYSLAAFTFPCLLFLVATFITLMFLSRQRLLMLRQVFSSGPEGEELRKKKALIPYLF